METPTAGIVAFSFGAPATICSNWHIAEIASQKARKLNAPVYTQLDIHIEPKIEVVYTDEHPGHPPPTLRIARGAARWAKQQGFKYLYIVAAKPHYWRCLRDLTQAIRETKIQVKVYLCKKEIEQLTEDEWFCPESTQPRTCSRKNWQKRELILKLMPFFIYKHVAS